MPEDVLNQCAGDAQYVGRGRVGFVAVCNRDSTAHLSKSW